MALTTDSINTSRGWCSLTEHHIRCTQHLWKVFLDGFFCDLELVSNDGQFFNTHIPVIMGALENHDIIQELDGLLAVHKKKLWLQNVTANQVKQVLSYAYGKAHGPGGNIVYDDIQKNISEIVLQLLGKLHTEDVSTEQAVVSNASNGGNILVTAVKVEPTEKQIELKTNSNGQQSECKYNDLVSNRFCDFFPQASLQDVDQSIVKKEKIDNSQLPQAMSMTTLNDSSDTEHLDVINTSVLSTKEEMDEDVHISHHESSSTVSNISFNHAYVHGNPKKHSDESDWKLENEKYKEHTQVIPAKALIENCIKCGVSTEVDLSLVKTEPLSDEEMETQHEDLNMHVERADGEKSEDDETWVDLENVSDTEYDENIVAVDIYKNPGLETSTYCTEITDNSSHDATASTFSCMNDDYKFTYLKKSANMFETGSQKIHPIVKHQQAGQPRQSEAPTCHNKYKPLLPKTPIIPNALLSSVDTVVPDKLDSCPLRPVKLFVNNSSIGGQSEDIRKNERQTVAQADQESVSSDTSVQSCEKSFDDNKHLTDSSVECKTSECIIKQNNNINENTNGPVMFPLASNSIYIAPDGKVYSFPMTGNNIQTYNNTQTTLGHPATMIPPSGQGNILPMGMVPMLPQLVTPNSQQTGIGSSSTQETGPGSQQLGTLASISNIQNLNLSPSSLNYKISIPRLTSLSSKNKSSDVSSKMPMPKLRKVLPLQQTPEEKNRELHQTFSVETSPAQQVETGIQEYNQSTISQLSDLVGGITKDGSSVSMQHQAGNFLSLGKFQQICAVGPQNSNIYGGAAVLQQNAQTSPVSSMKINPTNQVPPIIVNAPQSSVKMKIPIPRLAPKVLIPKSRRKRNEDDPDTSRTIAQILSRSKIQDGIQNHLLVPEKCCGDTEKHLIEKLTRDDCGQKTNVDVHFRESILPLPRNSDNLDAKVSVEFNALENKKSTCSEMNVGTTDVMQISCNVSKTSTIAPTSIPDALHMNDKKTVKIGGMTCTSVTASLPVSVSVSCETESKFADSVTKLLPPLRCSSEVNKDGVVIKTFHYQPETIHKKTSHSDEHLNTLHDSDVDIGTVSLSKQMPKDQDLKKKGSDGVFSTSDSAQEFKLEQSEVVSKCMYLDPSQIRNITKTALFNAHSMQTVNLNFQGDKHTIGYKLQRPISSRECSSESEEIQSCNVPNHLKTKYFDKRRTSSLGKRVHCISREDGNFYEDETTPVKQKYKPILPKSRIISGRGRRRNKGKQADSGVIDKTDSMVQIMTSQTPELSSGIPVPPSCTSDQSDHSGETMGHCALGCEDITNNLSSVSQKSDTILTSSQQTNPEVLEKSQEVQDGIVCTDASDEVVRKTLPLVAADNLNQNKSNSNSISQLQNTAAVSTLLSFKLCVNEQGNPVYKASDTSHFPFQQPENKIAIPRISFKTTSTSRACKKDSSSRNLYSKLNFAPIAPKR